MSWSYWFRSWLVADQCRACQEETDATDSCDPTSTSSSDLLLTALCVVPVAGQCLTCQEKVTGASEACQAMGNLYHTKCFTCCSCGKSRFTLYRLVRERGVGWGKNPCPFSSPSPEKKVKYWMHNDDNCEVIWQACALKLLRNILTASSVHHSMWILCNVRTDILLGRL